MCGKPWQDRMRKSTRIMFVSNPTGQITVTKSARLIRSPHPAQLAKFGQFHRWVVWRTNAFRGHGRNRILETSGRAEKLPNSGQSGYGGP